MERNKELESESEFPFSLWNLLDICEYLDITDIISLSKTNKKIYDFLTPFIEKRISNIPWSICIYGKRKRDQMEISGEIYINGTTDVKDYKVHTGKYISGVGGKILKSILSSKDTCYIDYKYNLLHEYPVLTNIVNSRKEIRNKSLTVDLDYSIKGIYISSDDKREHEKQKSIRFSYFGDRSLCNDSRHYLVYSRA